MSVVINTNYAATLAANNLSAASTSLQRSLTRLSSGSKIVNPQDDAAGLAVSMKLAATARRQSAVSSNIGNAISFLQTQDGALQVAGKVLNRIGELKTLYTDPTKNSADLANYQSEFAELQSELSSLGNETFNGIDLFGSSTLSVSSSADSAASSIAIGGADLLGSATPAWTDVTGAAPGADWTASSVGIGAAAGYTKFHTDGTLTSAQSNISGPYQLDFTFNGLTVGSGTMSLTGGGSGSLDFTTLGGSALDGNDHAMAITVDSSGNATWSVDSGALTGSVGNFASPSGGAVTFTISNTAGGNDLHVKNDLTLTGSGGSGSTDYATVAQAANLGALNLSDVTSATQNVATLRATNGAQQSRLQFAAEVLTVNKANIEAANSRISDVDVAEESTTLARFNILVQSGTAMLSQANQSAQMALKLLG